MRKQKYYFILSLGRTKKKKILNISLKIFLGSLSDSNRTAIFSNQNTKMLNRRKVIDQDKLCTPHIKSYINQLYSRRYY